jgi:hypothetical protein
VVVVVVGVVVSSSRAAVAVLLWTLTRRAVALLGPRVLQDPGDRILPVGASQALLVDYVTPVELLCAA